MFMTVSGLLACFVGAPSGFVIWSLVFRLPEPFTKWALEPFGRAGPISLGLASIFATIFMLFMGAVAVVVVADVIALPGHVADPALRRAVFGWSAVGYILPLVTVRFRGPGKRKLKREHTD
jgi:hypothetical protein